MNEGKVIDGKAFAETLRSDIATKVAKLKADRNITPGLAVVLVGNNPASEVYVRNKGKMAEALGLTVETLDTTELRKAEAALTCMSLIGI